MIRFLLTLALLASTTFAAEKNFEEFWERAVVTVEVTRKQYDYHQPWSRRVDQIQKMGTIINGHEILTTADQLSNHTLIRLQKGRGRWFQGHVNWVDYQANLATIVPNEEKFWEGTEAVELANNTRFGLAASVWTENINLALDIAPRIKAGTVWINSTNLFDAASGNARSFKRSPALSRQ